MLAQREGQRGRWRKSLAWFDLCLVQYYYEMKNGEWSYFWKKAIFKARKTRNQIVVYLLPKTPDSFYVFCSRGANLKHILLVFWKFYNYVPESSNEDRWRLFKRQVIYEFLNPCLFLLLTRSKHSQKSCVSLFCTSEVKKAVKGHLVKTVDVISVWERKPSWIYCFIYYHLRLRFHCYFIHLQGQWIKYNIINDSFVA